jgi:F0F1-type ATP synthase assembly protein I
MINKPPDKKQKFDNFIRYSSLGFEMVAIMALGAWGGIKLDAWLQTNFPYFSLGLIILSVIAAIYHAVKNFL